MRTLLIGTLGGVLLLALVGCDRVYEGPSGTFTEIREPYATPPPSFIELLWRGLWGYHGASAHGYKTPK
jgi:hypothetical protein